MPRDGRKAPLVTRLEHERHLGALLEGTGLQGRRKGVVGEDTLPDGVSRDLSSIAQVL